MDFLGRELIGADPVSLHQALNGRELIGLIENLKGLGQPRFLKVSAKHAIAQTVKRPHPHAARVHRNGGLNTGEHFLGGFIGKRDRENLHGACHILFNKPSDACC